MRLLSFFVFLSIAPAAGVLAQDQQEVSTADGICTSVENLRTPVIAPESPADAKWLEGCSAADLYYGASPHQDVDFAAARRCALSAWNARRGQDRGNRDNSGDLFDFSTQILAMIYANGDGVPRDLDLATHIVCREVFPLENPVSDYAGQQIHVILQLAKMKQADAAARFDYCSSEAKLPDWPEKLVCATIQTRLARKRREAHFAELAASWTGEQKDAFAQARESFAQYENMEERAENTCAVPAVLCTMEIDDRLEAEFAADMDRFEQGKLPRSTHQDSVAADGALKAQYQQLHLAAYRSAGNLRDKIRDAQRAWLEYRAAFAAFARLRWPSEPGDSWFAFLARERVNQMKKIVVQ